jgi:hypothetical protein
MEKGLRLKRYPFSCSALHVQSRSFEAITVCRQGYFAPALAGNKARFRGVTFLRLLPSLPEGMIEDFQKGGISFSRAQECHS